MQFTVKKVGKIDQASFELKPLTILIGQNNSGKTYAASALWAAINSIKKRTILGDSVKTELILLIHQLTAKALQEKSPQQKDVPESLSNKIKAEVSCYLEQNSRTILKQCFKFDGFDEESKLLFNNEPNLILSINVQVIPILVSEEISAKEEKEFTACFTFKWRGRKESHHNEVLEYKIRAAPLSEALLTEHESELYIALLERTEKEIIGHTYFGEMWDKFENLLYIPAARTGILLTSDFFIQGTIARWKEATEVLEKENDPFLLTESSEERHSFVKRFKGNLTEPLIAFTEEINRRSSVRNQKAKGSTTPLNNIKRLLSGDIRSNSPNADRPTFEYQPEGLEHAIPLSASSSLVTEVAALSILNPVLADSFIIFEEPEAHLHLAAQREMAKIIIQLVNSGCYLLITTHSDTFLQQLNNLLLLNNHPQKARLLKKFGLTDDDILAPNQVSAYDFDCDGDHRTTVHPVAFGEYGFVAESLNKVLISLAEQSHEIITTLEREGD